MYAKVSVFPIAFFYNLKSTKHRQTDVGRDEGVEGSEGGTVGRTWTTFLLVYRVPTLAKTGTYQNHLCVGRLLQK